MKEIKITVNQAWAIRKLLKGIANNIGAHCDKTFRHAFESSVIDTHNWLEHEMIKQLKGE